MGAGGPGSRRISRSSVDRLAQTTRTSAGREPARPPTRRRPQRFRSKVIQNHDSRVAPSGRLNDLKYSRLPRITTMCAHVVVAEDDEKQAELARRYLEREGHSVVVTHDGRAALEELRCRPADLLILDVMMPRVGGLDVCRILRAESDVPVLMLTARSSEDDLILGLDLGADDYMTKPYSPRELMARVRTLLRRPGKEGIPDPVLKTGESAWTRYGMRFTLTADTSTSHLANSASWRPWRRSPTGYSHETSCWDICTALAATSPRARSTCTSATCGRR